MRELHCAHVLTAADAAVASGRTIRIDGGRIVAVAPAQPGEPVLAMPVLVNAHDHARAVRSSSFGAGGKPLETWLHYLALLPSVDPYLASAVSLARSALGGAGVVMVHYTRVQGLTDLPTEAARWRAPPATSGCGSASPSPCATAIRWSMDPRSRCWPACPPSPRKRSVAGSFASRVPSAEQVTLVDAVAAAAASALFDVQYGPQGVQWCTPELLAAVAEASQRSGRRVHMHLLETRYQRDWADAAYPDGIVRYLDRIGLLSARLTLAHCTWARPDELELVAERGATIAVNTSSNLGLRSGITPLAEMVRRGCRVALGLDGLALDEDDDALREMRLAHLLHGGSGFRIDVDRSRLLEMAFLNGRRSVLNDDDGGTLAGGQPADILLLDWNAVDDDRLRPDLDPLDLLFARTNARHLREVIVDGRSIVRDGRVTGIDFPAMRTELVERLRSGLRENMGFAGASARARARDHAAHFDTQPPCC